MIIKLSSLFTQSPDIPLEFESDLANAIAPQILIKEFVDLDLDVIGWYTLGHYDAETFITKVRDSVPGYRLYRVDVEHVWATFSNQGMELFDEPIDDAQSVTLVRYFEPLA
jgi:hypothetical protein